MERYSRNYNSITKENQRILFNSTVAIVGLGGLGGYVLENLVRLGVGSLHIIDYDVLQESNLNRQILSREDNMGSYKTTEAFKRAKIINNNISIRTFTDKLDRNKDYLLKNVDIVVDCLDSIESRRELEILCDKLNLTLVHGAIGGYIGQVALSSPGNRIFDKLYKDDIVDISMGNLPMICMVIASIQVTIILKYLFKEKIDSEFIYINLKDLELLNLQL